MHWSAMPTDKFAKVCDDGLGGSHEKGLVLWQKIIVECLAVVVVCGYSAALDVLLVGSGKGLGWSESDQATWSLN